MAATTALRNALNQGISSGNLVDTKIILYSHRDSSGRVCCPKALYANSHVLRTVPYFNDLLFGNFAESQSKDFKEAIDEAESAEDYGYSSDSDLGDDEDKPASFEPATEAQVNSSDPFATHEEHDERVEKGKVVKIPDMAFVTSAQPSNLLSISLMSLQFPSFSDVSLYERDRVRTVWVRTESQIAKRGNRRTF
ncbi:hypothetical protein BDM02DRAFT_3124819 [Thelephora ganbajun]|uniref:Uncharacterized protein n=1 Tax=Thelephora ganbajun TaxID=370292 RepID=A0ACB6YYC1_THEGA|nr:hypothetical protein BDM02DRAFT_3124819 [Thelephora ganbajun]